MASRCKSGFPLDTNLTIKKIYCSIFYIENFNKIFVALEKKN